MSEIVTDVESEAVPPFPSVRVTVAWYEPVWEYACAVGAPEPDELSPKSHAYEYDPSPPELAASKVSVVPGAARLWLTEAVTEGFGLMTTFFESVATPSRDRKSTRLNSSHGYISYAVFCLKKKKNKKKNNIRK